MKRDTSIIVMIEEVFKDMLGDVASEQKMTSSTYVRGLIIADLKTRGLVTPTTMMNVILGIDAQEPEENADQEAS